jgi:hypothetical protein
MHAVATQHHLPRAVTLDPGILGENKAVQLFTKVLNHIVSFGFTVDQQVETNLLLESDDSLNLRLDEFFVFLFGDLFFAQFGTSLANFLGLLETEYELRLL